MNHFSSPMIGLELCTIEDGYGFTETLSSVTPVGVQGEPWVLDVSSRSPSEGARKQPVRSVDEFGQTISIPFPGIPDRGMEASSVTVRVRDIAQGLKSMSDAQLAWIEDLGDDPIVLTSDFYEVFLACQKIMEERRRAS